MGKDNNDLAENLPKKMHQWLMMTGTRLLY